MPTPANTTTANIKAAPLWGAFFTRPLLHAQLWHKN